MNEVNIEGQVLEDTGLNQELEYENVPVADSTGMGFHLILEINQ